RALNPSISPAVESLVLRTLAKRREARPQTAGDMARDLIAAMAGADLSSPHPTMVAAPEVILPAPVTTEISNKARAPQSNSGAVAVTAPDEVQAFGKAFTKMGSSRKLRLGFGALLLLAGGAAGLWWYAQKSANGKVMETRVSPGSGQRA